MTFVHFTDFLTLRKVNFIDLLAFIRENALSHIVILIWVIIRYILNTNVGQYSTFKETYSLGLDFLSNLWNTGVRVSAFRNKLSNMQKSLDKVLVL